MTVGPSAFHCMFPPFPEQEERREERGREQGGQAAEGGQREGGEDSTNEGGRAEESEEGGQRTEDGGRMTREEIKIGIGTGAKRDAKQKIISGLPPPG